MQISRLSERITFEKNTPLVDENANHRNHWEPYYTCSAFAGSSGYRQSESEEAGVTVSDDALIFTVRYCSELSDLDTTHYRIRFRESTYNITAVDWMNYDHLSIQISCEKERRDSNVSE